MIAAQTTVMTVAGVVCAVIAVVSAVWIIRSLRRAKLTFAFGMAWLAIVVAVVVVGLGGGYVVDPIGRALGISYPPALFFLLAIFVLLGLCAHLSAQLAKLEHDVRAMSQRYALDHSEAHDASDPPDSRGVRGRPEHAGAQDDVDTRALRGEATAASMSAATTATATDEAAPASLAPDSSVQTTRDE